MLLFLLTQLFLVLVARMSDEKDSPGHPEEPLTATSEASMPMRMQLFSTWEVRKVPANCVSR